MSKNCGREAGGLTAKKQWWLRAYSPRSVTHAWVCPGFPEKDEEVTCGTYPMSTHLVGRPWWTGQDLDLKELSCPPDWYSLSLSVHSLLECHLLPLIAVIFLSGLWIELSSLPPQSLSLTTFEHHCNDYWWEDGLLELNALRERYTLILAIPSPMVVRQGDVTLILRWKALT